AQQLGLPKGTIFTRLSRARELLRARLARQGLALSSAASATLLAEECASAAVPASLQAAVAQGATLVAGGKAPTGLLSAEAEALANSTLHGLTISRRAVLTVVFGLILLGTSAVLLTFQALTRQPSATVDSRLKLRAILQ